MNRIAFSFVVAALALAPVARVWADEPPTKEQIDAAKKAFGEGKQLHDAGKLPEAIDKFKESYRLSKNPVLLYNIALTLDENKQADSALFYYRKFLSDAPGDAQQRKPAEDRVKVLENDKLNNEMSGKGGEAPDSKPGKKHSSTKYTAADFKHNVVEEAPPNKPLDIAATIPEGADLSVVLYYRAAGQPDFVAKPMKWHDSEVVARIPAKQVTGSALQYYIEVKDSGGNKLTSAGKPTSPNLINIDASAAEHSYSDFVDDMPVKEPKKHKETEDDPLGGGTKPEGGDDTGPKDTGDTGPAGTGMFDPGSHKFEVTKWSVTGGAVLFVGLTVVFDVMAGAQANALVQDSQRTSCTPHCTFDGYDASIQSAGERDETLSRVSLGLGIAGAVVAGYFWYRDLTHHNGASNTEPAPAEPSVVVVPTLLGNDTYGAAAAVRF